MKIIKASILIVIAVITLTSSIPVNTENNVTTTVTGYCPGPNDVQLFNEFGQRTMKVLPNKQFTVWAKGGVNSESACIVSGTGYTVIGSGCQDLGYNNFYPIAVIQTALSLPSPTGISIQINNTCTSGNGAITSFWNFRF
jgi:hypothetical protein